MHPRLTFDSRFMKKVLAKNVAVYQKVVCKLELTIDLFLSAEVMNRIGSIGRQK